MVTRIERPRRRRSVCLLGLLFLLLFIILLGIGAKSPAVLTEFRNTNEGTTVTYRERSELNVYSAIFRVTREHQLFWVNLRLSTGEEGQLEELMDSGEVKYVDLDLTIDVKAPINGELDEITEFSKKVTQRCVVAEQWCDAFFAWRRDFVDFDEYHVRVRLPDPDDYLTFDERITTSSTLFDLEPSMTAINPEFTRFEIVWKYVWFVATLLVMFAPCGLGFLWKLHGQRRDPGSEPRSYHQRWTMTLLWSLLFFNDPFVAATVYTDWAKFFSAFFIASASVFVVLILLFWLCFLSDLRFMQHRREEIQRGASYWAPKVVLTVGIGLTVFSGYMYYRFWDTVTPEYTGVDDEKRRAEEYAVLLGIMLTVYMLWILILVLRSCGLLRRISASYTLLFCITLLTCLMAVIGVFVAAYYPYSTSGTAFVGVHGLMNLYIWTLAASFAPVSGGREVFPKGPPAAEMTTVVVGGTEIDNGDISAWTDHADHDFKAVEL